MQNIIVTMVVAILMLLLGAVIGLTGNDLIPPFTLSLTYTPRPAVAPTPSTPVPAPTPAPTSTPAPEPTKQAELQVVKEWTGNGIKTTETFTISGAPWVISWSNNPQIMGGESVGMLQIMVYDTENPDFPITLAANTNEKGSATSYIYETGTFYLTINAANTEWTVEVLASQ